MADSINGRWPAHESVIIETAITIAEINTAWRITERNQPKNSIVDSGFGGLQRLVNFVKRTIFPDSEIATMIWELEALDHQHEQTKQMVDEMVADLRSRIS